MNIIKKFRKSEKGSITVMVLSAMLFLIGTITVSYFAMSNKSIDQNKKVSQIAKQYKASDEDMEKEYQKAVNNLKVEDYVKVGDYVDYNPTIASKDGTKVEESKLSYTSPTGTASEHGNGYTSTETGGGQTFTANSNIKWRVLNVEQDGTIELISEDAIKTDSNQNFILTGARGYLYIEQELNEVCKIYGYGYGADLSKGGTCTTGGPLDVPTTKKIDETGARSVTIEDINKKAGVTEKDYLVLNHNYGSTKNPTIDVYYPTVDITKGDAITGKSNSPGVKNLEDTYYSYGSEKVIDEDVRNMLFIDTPYWLASRYFITSSERGILLFT